MYDFDLILFSHLLFRRSGRASRMVQHFRGQLSALTIERNEEIDRASNCIQDCKQYIEVVDMEKGANIVNSFKKCLAFHH